MNINQVNSPTPSFDLLAELRALLARAEASQKGVHVTSAAPAPVIAPTPTAPKAATKETRKWLLDRLSVYGDDLVKFARSKAILLPTETLKDWPLHKVPTTKDSVQELIREIEDWRKDQIPMSWPTKELPVSEKKHDGFCTVCGVGRKQGDPCENIACEEHGIKHVGEMSEPTSKAGETNGRKWTLYGMVVGERHFTTFDTKLVDAAKLCIGQQCEVIYREDPKGKKLISITPIGGVTP